MSRRLLLEFHSLRRALAGAPLAALAADERLADAAAAGYLPVRPRLALGIVEQHLDGLVVVVVGPAQAVLGVAADRRQQRLTAGAGANLGQDLAALGGPGGAHPVEAVDDPMLAGIQITEDGDRRKDVAGPHSLGIVPHDFLVDLGAHLEIGIETERVEAKNRVNGRVGRSFHTAGIPRTGPPPVRAGGE